MISHKLNEIEAIADAITILRDGRTVETLDVRAGAVDEDRIIRGMVGRSLDSRFPDHTPPSARVLRGQGWTVAHPRCPTGWCAKGSSSSSAGRDRRFRRPDGCRSDGADALDLRPLLRHVLRGRMVLNGKEVQLRNVPAAIDAGIGYVTEDRKFLGLNLLDDIKTTTVSAKLKKIAKYFVVDRRAEHRSPRTTGKQLRTKAPSVDHGVAKLSGGNQQKVVLAEVAVHRPRPADPRRAHPGHRRRRQVRDLRDHPAAGRARVRASSSSRPSSPSCSVSPTASTPSPRAPSPASSTRPRPTRSH